MKSHVVARSPAAEAAVLPDAGGSRPAPSVTIVQDFASVYEAHAAFVWRVLRGMGVSDAQIEDAVQNVFIVVHRRLHEFDGRHSIRTWLAAIAFRVASEERRRYKRGLAHQPLDEDFGDARPGPAEHAERREGLRILEHLLEQLDDQKRAVLVLAELEGMTVPEIAAASGVPVNTVYTRLRRARVELEAALSAWRTGEKR